MTKKGFSMRPVLDEHATKHSCLWTFLPSYKQGNPNSVHFYQNSLEVPQLRCSCERELDTPKYPHYSGQLQLGDLLLILLLSFLHIQQLLITVITNIIIKCFELAVQIKEKHSEGKMKNLLAYVNGIGCSNESELYHGGSSLLRLVSQAENKGKNCQHYGGWYQNRFRTWIEVVLSIQTIIQKWE